MQTHAPIIMTATMAPADFAWANSLRRAHYPVDRNQVDAHITLFHQLPGSLIEEIRRRTALAASANPPPAARISDLMNMGSGVAIKLESPELLAIREALADGFFGLLSAQDQPVPRFHITIQNKVSSVEAKQTFALLRPAFDPRPFGITGLALHHYRGGPWEAIGQWSFRGQRTKR